MAGNNAIAGPTRQLKILEKTRLVEAVDQVGIMVDPQKRQMILTELRSEFGPEFDPSRSGGTNSDTWSIVNTCLKVGAMRELVSLLRILGGESPEWQSLNTLVQDLLRPSTADSDQRKRLDALLRGLPLDSLPLVLGDSALAPHLPFAPGHIADSIEAYRRLEEVSGPTGRRAQLVFLELAAHRLDQQAAVELHRLIDDVADELGGGQIAREFCSALYERASHTDDPPALPEEPEPTETGDTVNAAVEATPGDDVNTAATKTPAVEPGTASRPAVWGGVPPRNSNFTGRTDLLDAVHGALREHVQAMLLPQPLHGLGGIGKSQLAIEFAYRYQFDYDLVWWVQADDDRSIRRSLVSLAKRLDLPQSDAVEDTVDGALDVLRRGELHRRWLLIYDNADDPASLQPYLPSGPGHVLITSRNRGWANERNAIEVDVFSPDESVELLRNRWPELTTDEALLLAGRLGHLPLALEQAVAVHRQTGMQLDEYLGILESHPTAVLEEGVPAGYPSSVAVTLRVAYGRLKERSLAAAQLLELCAFLSPHPIAVPMLMRGRGAPLPSPLDTVIRDDARLRMVVRDLGRFALAQIDPGRDLIRIHSLIGAVLRDGLTPEEKADNERYAHAVLGLANPGRPDDPVNWPHHAQIAPHVIPSGVLYSPNPDARRVALDQIRYFLAVGDYAASKDLGERAVETWKGSLGPDDEMTLVASRHLANALRALGEYGAARAINQDVLERMRRTLTPEHEHTLATAMNFAADLRLLGEFERARVLEEENLDRYRQVMGEDDLATLRQAHNLAVDYRLLGNYRRARELDEATARRRAEILGEDHPRTLYSYASLVRDLDGLGEYQKALAMQRDKLRLHEQRLVPHHVELMLAKRNLAILWRKTGNYRRALDQALANYDVYRTVFGQHHEHTLASMITLSHALRVTGDADSAYRRVSEALPRYRETFGEQHPFTYACAVDVAIALRAIGRHDEARAMNEDGLEGLRQLIGDDHPYTMCAASNKTNDLAAAGKHREARALSEEILLRSTRVRGEDHPATLICAANLALDLDATGEGALANQMRKDTLTRMRDRLGSEHPEIIRMSMGARLESEIELPVT